MSGSGEIICCSTPVLLKPSCSRSMANRGRRTVAGTLTHRFAIARLAVPLAVAMPHHLERSQIATAWSHSRGGRHVQVPVQSGPSFSNGEYSVGGFRIRKRLGLTCGRSSALPWGDANAWDGQIECRDKWTSRKS